MYLRKLWLIIAVLGAMCSPVAFGLGLGEVTLNSNLNQPLDAEIRLLQVGDLSEQEIFVQLGSAEDFERRGIDRDFFLLNIDFEVQLNSPRGAIVKLTTQQPVVEPLLSFIVQLEWPSGKIQREYNLLMDLPVFTERPAQPVQQPRAQPQPAQPPVQPSQPEPQPVQPAPQQPRRSTTAAPPPPLPTRPDSPQPSRPQPQPTPSQPSPQPEPLSPSLQSGETYQVVSNDTLWEIALRTRPNRGVSVQQTMLALQRLNPEAFINNNINLLREGQVLRIPSEAEIQQLDRQSAVSEVAYQNTQWSGDPDGRLARGAELQGSRTVTRDDTADDSRRGQLTLASPSDTPRATGDRSGSTLSASEQDALENELAITLEQLDASERESAELNERIEELEEQIATMERLIEVSNEDMRQLQLALEENATPSETAEPAPGAEPTVEETPTDSADTSEPANVPAATPQPQQPAVAPVQPARPQQSIVDMLMDYIWYIGIGIVVILLGAFYMWHRKTQAEMASFDDFDQETFDEQDELDFADDDFGGEGFDQHAEAEDDFDLGMDDSAVDDDAPMAEAEPAAPTEAETGDAVGEADIYIAYGKYDQAEEMLQRAIINEPDNIDARLKLLEVYSETANGDKFDGEYSKLLALGDASANARAAELRSNIPGIGQYETPAGASAEPSAPAQDSGDDLDFDLDLGVDDTQSTSEASDEGFDFDLDEDSDDSFANLDLSEETTEEVAPEPATEADDDSIDFNLDLDDDTELSLDSDDDGDLNLDLDGDDDVSGGLELDTESDDQELSLDLDEDDDLSFDLDADESEFDKQFDTSLDEEPADSATNETLSRDFDFDEPSEPAAEKKDTAGEDDILSDLEFSAANLASEQDKDENLAESASALDMDTGGGADEGDDDFDLDMGDVDLAALDEEMDALVGDLDEVDDEDVAVSPTDVVPALTDDDLDSAGFDFDEADSEPESKAEPEPTPAAAASTADDEAGLEEDSELDFLADTDEVATKLDLARAYIDMGDQEGAKDILGEVVAEGNDEQRQEAEELLGKIK